MEINGKTKKWLVLSLCCSCGSLWGEMSQTHDELLAAPAVQAPDEEILTKYSDAPTVQTFEEKPQVQKPQNTSKKSKVKSWFKNAWKKVKEFFAPVAKELQDELSKQANELAKQLEESAREAVKQTGEAAQEAVKQTIEKGKQALQQKMQELCQTIKEAPQRAAAAATALYNKFHLLHSDALKTLVAAADAEQQERLRTLRQYVHDYGEEERTQYRQANHLEHLTDAELAQHLRTLTAEQIAKLPLTLMADLWNSLLPQEIPVYFSLFPLWFRSIVYGSILFQNATAGIACPLFAHISEADRILYAAVLLRRRASREWLQQNIRRIPATIHVKFAAVLNPQIAPKQPFSHEDSPETEDSLVKR